MRAVVVGPRHGWSTADVANGWMAGLTELGISTWQFDLSQQLAWFQHAEVEGERLSAADATSAVGLNLLAETYLVDPDVVFIVHGADVDFDAVRALRCHTVLVLTEHPYEAEGQLIAADAMRPDLILVNDPAGAQVYEQVAPAYYVPHAYNPAVHHPGGGDHKYDACFIGTGFHNRVRFLEAVDWTGIDLALGGMWAPAEGGPLERFIIHDDAMECVDNTDTAETYRASRCGFNIYRADSHGEHSSADGWAIGPRELELAACGVPFARDPRPESDELFSMLPTFSTPEELGDVLRWLIAHPDERTAAATAARAAIEDRTFANNARRALARLGL